MLKFPPPVAVTVPAVVVPSPQLMLAVKSEPGSGLPGSLAVATRTVAELFSGTEKAWAVMLSDCSPTVAVVVGEQ